MALRPTGGAGSASAISCCLAALGVPSASVGSLRSPGRGRRRKPVLPKVIAGACRVVVGAVFLVSGTLKLRQPAWRQTAAEFGAPPWLAPMLPAAEIVLGALLISQLGGPWVPLAALALRRRGAVVRTVAPDTESSAAMEGDLMDPEPRARVLAAGYAQGLREGSEIRRP